MSNVNNNVVSLAIPKSAFRMNIRGYTRRDGHGLDECLWREMLQNSRDAGATRVTCTLTRDGDHIVLCVQDDGCGMTWDTLVAGMLTYGGSVKREGAAGGFGMAKLVVCFSSDETMISTTRGGLTHAVRIEGADHIERMTAVEGDPADGPSGTTFTLRCPQTEAPDLRLEPTIEGLRFLLSRSDMRGMQVTCNGERIRDCKHELSSESLCKSFSEFSGEAHYWKRRDSFMNFDGSAKVCPLMHRGIWVCDMGMPSDMKGCVLVNLEADPKLVLNDTRTGLSSYWHRSLLEKFIASIQKGASSVLKTKRFVRRFDGPLTILASAEAAAEATVRSMLEAPGTAKGKGLVGNLCVDDMGAYLRACAAKVNAAQYSGSDRIQTTEELIDASRFGDGSMSEREAVEAVKTLVWSPALMVKNELEWSIKAQFLPETMGPRVRNILIVWNEMVKQLLLLRRIFIPYGVGLIFSEDCAAQYHKETDGSRWFLLNICDKEGLINVGLSRSEDRSKVMSLAAHEVAHETSDADDYHSDGFVTEYDRNVQLLLDNDGLFKRVCGAPVGECGADRW